MATKGKEYKLAIRIAGVIDKSFNASLATANTALKANILAMDKNFITLDKGFDATMNAGKKCFGAIATAAGVAGAAVAAATVASVAVGKEFETAFTGVKKTVDATDEEYAKLRQNILDMSEEIPSSASDMAFLILMRHRLYLIFRHLWQKYRNSLQQVSSRQKCLCWSLIIQAKS